MFQSIETKHPKFYQVFRVIVVVSASVLYAWNLCCFAKTAGLLPGGFSGISLLLQEIGIKFAHVEIPYTLFNIVLNLFPVYIGFKYPFASTTLVESCAINADPFRTDNVFAFFFRQLVPDADPRVLGVPLHGFGVGHVLALLARPVYRRRAPTAILAAVSPSVLAHFG